MLPWFCVVRLITRKRRVYQTLELPRLSTAAGGELVEGGLGELPGGGNDGWV